MKEAFEKIKERLEGRRGIAAHDKYESKSSDDRSYYQGAAYGYYKAIEIVNQVAAEYRNAKSEYVEIADLVEKLRSEAERQENLTKLLLDATERIEDLDDDVNEWVLTFDMLNDRENRTHYLEYWREKNGKSDLCYPDGDQIYKDFWELKRENDELRLKMSYMVDPNAIGDKHEMGW